MKTILKFLKWLFGRGGEKPLEPFVPTLLKRGGYHIYRVIKRCPGGFHVWLDTSIGPIRKETNKIPKNLI